MTAPRITIPPAHIEAALHIYGNTALASCMRWRTEDGAMFFEADRPLSTLSSGEQVLWAALEVILSGATFSVQDAAACGAVLDEPNLRALLAAVDMVAAVAS